MGDAVFVLVMELDSGIYGRLRLLQLDESGVITEPTLSATAAPSPYEASLVMVDEQHGVVVWQEGDNPAFRSYAEWVTISP